MKTARTRMDVMLELLDEVDAICRENGLKYSISGGFAKRILEEDKLPDVFDYIAIAMTSGDINRLIKIVEKENRQDRYFEYMVNNPNQLKLKGGFRYGNSNTTLISASSYGNNKYYGIFIYIIEVKKVMDTPARLKYYQMLHSSFLYDGNGEPSLKNTAKNYLKKIVDTQRDQKVRALTYEYYLNKRGIDKWEDIKHIPLVSISRWTFDNAVINKKKWDIIELEINEKKYMYCPMLRTHKLGNRSSHGIVSELEIVDTEIPYSEIIDTSIIDNVIKAQKYRKQRNDITKKGKEDFGYTRRAWRTFLMAKEIVEIKNDYLSAKENGDISSINAIIDKYQEKKESWLEREYPFIEVAEIEDEIKKRG